MTVFDTIDAPTLDWPKIIKEVEEARAERARSGYAGAVFLRVDETTGHLDWRVYVEMTIARAPRPDRPAST